MKVKLAFTAISEISPPGSLAVGCPPANPTKVTTIAFLSAGAGFLAFEEQKSNMLEARTGRKVHRYWYRSLATFAHSRSRPRPLGVDVSADRSKVRIVTAK